MRKQFQWILLLPRKKVKWELMGFHSANQIHMAERKVALDSLSAAKSFLLRHSLLTAICFKNYSIIFIDISVQLRRLKHLQFAQNREIWTCALVPKQRKTFDIIPLYIIPFLVTLSMFWGWDIHFSVCVPWFLTSFSHHNLGVVPSPPPLLAEDHQKYGKVVVGPQA